MSNFDSVVTFLLFSVILYRIYKYGKQEEWQKILKELAVGFIVLAIGYTLFNSANMVAHNINGMLFAFLGGNAVAANILKTILLIAITALLYWFLEKKIAVGKISTLWFCTLSFSLLFLASVQPNWAGPNNVNYGYSFGIITIFFGLIAVIVHWRAKLQNHLAIFVSFIILNILLWHYIHLYYKHSIFDVFGNNLFDWSAYFGVLLGLMVINFFLDKWKEWHKRISGKLIYLAIFIFLGTNTYYIVGKIIGAAHPEEVKIREQYNTIKREVLNRDLQSLQSASYQGVERSAYEKAITNPAKASNKEMTEALLYVTALKNVVSERTLKEPGDVSMLNEKKMKEKFDLGKLWPPNWFSKKPRKLIEGDKTKKTNHKLYLPGPPYAFSLKAGEKTDHWITFPNNQKIRYSINSADYNYRLLYDDGSVLKDGQNVRYPTKHPAKFKIEAISDQPDIKMTVKIKS